MYSARTVRQGSPGSATHDQKERAEGQSDHGPQLRGRMARACARSGRDRRQAGDPRPAGVVPLRFVRPAAAGGQPVPDLVGDHRRRGMGPGTSPAAAPGATGGEPQGLAGLDGHTSASLAELQASRPTRCAPRCCRCRRTATRRRWIGRRTGG